MPPDQALAFLLLTRRYFVPSKKTSLGLLSERIAKLEAERQEMPGTSD